MMFQLSTFQIQQLKLLQNFENATILMRSMVKLSKYCQNIMEIVLISAAKLH